MENSRGFGGAQSDNTVMQNEITQKQKTEMEPSIVVRIWFRWMSKNVTEPTSTLVLTSPANNYVDIRAYKLDKFYATHFTSINWKDNLYATLDNSTSGSTNSSNKIEWAFAGKSSYTTTISERQQQSPKPHYLGHGIWEHWVDSQVALKDIAEVDEGDIFEHPNQIQTPTGRVKDMLQGIKLEVERGIMKNPRTKEKEEYEEVWANVSERIGVEPPVLPPHKKGICTVLKTRDQDEGWVRGMVIRVDGWCQGIMRLPKHANQSESGNEDGKVEEEVLVERWRLHDTWQNGRPLEWECLLSLPGEARLPTENVREMERSNMLSEGTEMVCEGVTWTVVESWIRD